MNTHAKTLYIGMMSGTSLDGIDVALVTFKDKLSVLAQTFLPFSIELKQQIKLLTTPGENEVERIAETEYLLTQCYATAVKTLLEKNTISAKDVCAIGAHGQTIRHIPPSSNHQGYTLQLLNPSLLAALTGIDVVSNFRQKDIALGGQGAPLVPAFHQYIFTELYNNGIKTIEPQKPVAIINIGGISNISWLNTSSSQGYDLGPGNTLLDNWYQKHQQGSYDKEGNWGKSGTLNECLLKELLQDKYFQLTPPKSTGPEYFNLKWLQACLRTNTDILPEDIQATLTELTALIITNAVNSVSPQAEVYICGGGQHNKFLLNRINTHLLHPLKLTQELGIDGDYMEAAAFAWLAMSRVRKHPVELKQITGASKNAILGGLFLAG